MDLEALNSLVDIPVGLIMPRPPSLGGRPSRSRFKSFGGGLPVNEGMSLNKCNSQVGANGLQCWG